MDDEAKRLKTKSVEQLKNEIDELKAKNDKFSPMRNLDINKMIENRKEVLEKEHGVKYDKFGNNIMDR